MGRYLKWIVIAFIVFLIAYRPHVASNFVNKAAELIEQFFSGLGDMLGGINL